MDWEDGWLYRLIESMRPVAFVSHAEQDRLKAKNAARSMQRAEAREFKKREAHTRIVFGKVLGEDA